MPGTEEREGFVRLGPLRITHDMVLVAIMVILAFVIRLESIPSKAVLNGDGIYYTILGEKFFSGDFAGGISAYWSPLYSILTGIVEFIGANREFAGRLVSLLSGAFVLVPSFLLIRDFYGRRAAILGTLLLIFDPSSIRASGWVMTESLYTLVFVGFILTGWRAIQNDSNRSFFGTGVLIGISYLIKPEAIAYVILLPLVFLGLSILQRRLVLRKIFTSCLITFAGFSIFFLPYILFVHAKTGIWTISQKVTINLPAADFDGELLKILNGERKTMKDKVWGDDYGSVTLQPQPALARNESVPSDSPGLLSGIAVLAKKAMSQLIWQIRRYLPAILPIPLLFVAIAGFFSKPWTRERFFHDAYLASFVLATLTGYAISAVELRYLFPLIPIAAAWVGIGAIDLSEWAANSARAIRNGKDWLKPIYFQIGLTVLLVCSFVPLYAAYMRADTIDNVPYEEKEAGLWLKDHSAVPNPTVMSANITVAFYACAKHIYLPDETLPTIVAYAKERNTNYLVVSQRRIKDKDMVSSELSGVDEIAGLKEVYRDQSYPDHQVAIYELTY